MEAFINNLPSIKSPGKDGFGGLQKKRPNTNTLQIIPQNQTEGTLPNLFYEATIMLKSKVHKDPTMKENFRTKQQEVHADRSLIAVS